MNLFIFDIDGTLLKDNIISNEAFRKVLESGFGITRYSVKWEDYESSSDIGIFRELYKKKFDRVPLWDEVLQFEQLYINNIKQLLENGNQFTPYSGIVSLFSELKNQGAAIAIYTGALKRVAEIKLEALQLDGMNLPLSTAYDGFYRREIFSTAVNRAKVRYGIPHFERTVMAGDSYQDIAVAKELNIPMLGIQSKLTASAFISEGIKSIENYDDIFEVISLLMKI